MKFMLALFFGLCALGLFFSGLYVGGWLWFSGGIVDIINQIKAPTVDALTLAVGIAKIVFCEIPIYVGWFLAAVCVGIATESLK